MGKAPARKPPSEDVRIEAGKLRHYVMVQRKVGTTQDSYGAPSPAWTNVGPAYAEIKSLEGEELLIANQVAGISTHRITMRYFRGLLDTDRITFENRTFDINYISDVLEKHIKHVCIVKEAI